MKKISILGSTGSVGTQALDLLKNNNQFEIDYLYADSNYKLLYNQIIEHRPKFACINNEESYKKLKETNIDMLCEFPLIDSNLSKDDALGIIWKSEIDLPKMYDLGYNHNNCIGCVKGGIGYWNKIKKDFPNHFKKMGKLEREIGNSILKHRSGEDMGKPLFLDKLEDNMGRYEEEPAISCSLSCGMVANELNET